MVHIKYLKFQKLHDFNNIHKIRIYLHLFVSSFCFLSVLVFLLQKFFFYLDKLFLYFFVQFYCEFNCWYVFSQKVSLFYIETIQRVCVLYLAILLNFFNNIELFRVKVGFSICKMSSVNKNTFSFPLIFVYLLFTLSLYRFNIYM